MPTSELTHESVTQILRLVDELPDGEVRIELGDLKLHLRKGSAELQPLRPSPAAASSEPVAPAPTPAVQPGPRSSAVMDDPGLDVATSTTAQPAPGLSAIRAPMLGRFYQAATPSDPPFVELGSRVGPDDTVCLIEVMKLFNTVSAGIAGTIVEILPENNALVEFDQVLFTVRPD